MCFYTIRSGDLMSTDLTTYDHVMQMDDDAKVFVSIETLERQMNDLTKKESRTTQEDAILLDEIKRILSDNRGNAHVLLPCKLIKRYISRENANIYSFKKIGID